MQLDVCIHTYMCRNVCLTAFLCRQMFVEVHFYVLGVYVSFCVVLVKLCRNICVFKYRYVAGNFLSRKVDMTLGRKVGPKKRQKKKSFFVLFNISDT